MRRHELDPISLVFGVAFTGLGLLLLTGRVDAAVRLRWIWPLLLLGLGVAILAGARPRRERAPEAPGAVAEPPAAVAAEPPADADAGAEDLGERPS